MSSTEITGESIAADADSLTVSVGAVGESAAIASPLLTSSARMPGLSNTSISCASADSAKAPAQLLARATISPRQRALAKGRCPTPF
ncbi:MAG: hypothetical protein AAFR26_04660 [Cyanobacteria bacterium J06626_4]